MTYKLVPCTSEANNGRTSRVHVIDQRTSLLISNIKEALGFKGLSAGRYSTDRNKKQKGTNKSVNAVFISFHFAKN